ncbi:MAG: gliding motility-associated C-terminal domain-containing protein [Brumimicrobium sp.]|nr:gliding motility-associated C-terminal domain-containing protein [Brumimicrobium sp.]
MKRTIILIFLFSIQLSILFSQKETNNWYFGANAGITFNTTPPTALLDGQMNTYEGCSSISDKDGNLLFYTNGITVWDRTHQIMPNGSGLMGHTSAAQSGIAIPKPGDSKKYYLITVPHEGSYEGMRYSIIDMTLNNGLGDVVSSAKNIPMFGLSSEKIAVVRHSNGVFFWIIGRYLEFGKSQTYITFLLDCDGIHVESPIIAEGISTTISENWGYLVASPDGKKLACASEITGIELLDFNNETGEISNPLYLGNMNYAGWDWGHYGVAFSPNSKILYGTNIENWAVAQWDLTAQDIPNSQFYLGDSEGSATVRPNYKGGAMQLGPDGKIYYCHTGNAFLGVINNPNVLGLGCNMQNNAVDLGGRQSRLGLPPFIQSFAPTIKNTTACGSTETQFEVQGGNFLDSIKWLFGDPNSPNSSSTELDPSHDYGQTGTFTVQLIRYFECGGDTITKEITITPPTNDTTYQDVLLCGTTSYTLPDNQLVTQSGVYYAQLQNQSGCDSICVFNITYQADFTAGPDQTICTHYATQLHASPGALNYSWAPSNTLTNPTTADPMAAPFATTTYTVVAMGDGCMFTDTVTIYVSPIPTGTHQLALCQGSTINYGGQSFSSEGTYTVNVSSPLGCDSLLTLVITEIPRPEEPAVSNNLPLECFNDNFIGEIINPDNSLGYNWYFDTTQNIMHTGNDWNIGVNQNITTIYVNADNGACTSSFTAIQIIANQAYPKNFEELIPNVITANNDGTNDEIDFYKIFGKCIEYKVTIINRWGNVVFETKNNGPNFTGKTLKGVKLNEGVYPYIIEYDGKEKHGFIHVLR